MATCAAASPELLLLISIHALRVEGDFVAKQFAVGFKISIHALRVEGDSTTQAMLR